MEPVSALIICLAKVIAGGVAGNRGDAAVTALVREFRSRVGLRDIPQNNEVTRALRKVHLRALNHVVCRYEKYGIGFTAVNTDSAKTEFLKSAHKFIKNELVLNTNIKVPIAISDSLNESTAAALSNDADGSSFESIMTAESAVFMELSDKFEIPREFEERFFGRVQGKRGWFDSFKIFLYEEISSNQKLFNILSSIKLSSVEIGVIDIKELIASLGLDVISYLNDVNDKLDDGFSQLLVEVRETNRKFDLLHSSLTASGIVGNAISVGATEEQVIAIIKSYVDGGLDFEQAKIELPKGVELLISLRDRFERIGDDSAQLLNLRSFAQSAIDSADFEAADRFLLAAEEAEFKAGAERMVRAAEIAANRGDLAGSQAKFEIAAVHYRRAADTVAFIDGEKRIEFLFKQGVSLYSQATLFPEMEALKAAIELFRDIIIPLVPATTHRDQCGWANSNLGMLLTLLGERLDGESGRLALQASIDAHRLAISLVDRQDVEAWASANSNLGNALCALGEKSVGPDSEAHLDEAIDTYHALVDDSLLKASPDIWARVNLNLGVSYKLRGERQIGSDSIDNISKSVSAFRNVIDIESIDKSPERWAMASDNLGLSLALLADRDGGAQSLALLHEAIECHTAALQVYDECAHPVDWARVKNNIGITLGALGSKTSGAAGADILGESIGALRDALRVRTRDAMPIPWSTTTMNLASALCNLSMRTGGAEGDRIAQEALNSVNAVSEVLTVGEDPFSWTAAQFKRAHVLTVIGKRISGPSGAILLSDAIASLESILSLHDEVSSAAMHTKISNNIGNAYTEMSRVCNPNDSLDFLRKAIIAYKAAVRCADRGQMSMDLASAHSNLGNSFAQLGERSEGPESLSHLSSAVSSYHEALKIYNVSVAPNDWARVQNNLGIALKSRGEIKAQFGREDIEKSVSALESALIIRTLESNRVDFATTAAALAHAFVLLSFHHEPEKRNELIVQGIQYYNKSLSVRTANYFPREWAETNHKLAHAQAMLAYVKKDVALFLVAEENISKIIGVLGDLGMPDFASMALAERAEMGRRRRAIGG